MRGSWIAVLSACFALATPAGAAELTGFGLIKFGMSKEEAWEAIEGRGEWVSSEKLQYSYPSDLWATDYRVRQNFLKDRATDVSIDLVLGGVGPQFCLMRGLYFAAIIETKYAVEPSVRHGTVQPEKPQARDEKGYAIEDLYAFAFDSNAGIHVIAQYVFEEPNCIIAFRYFPPSDYVVPF